MAHNYTVKRVAVKLGHKRKLLNKGTQASETTADVPKPLDPLFQPFEEVSPCWNRNVVCCFSKEPYVAIFEKFY